MNKISRLLLVFLLIILTVFAVSACTKKGDNQDNKTTMTEEPGIPLETYLNGNYINGMDPKIGGYSDKVTLTPTGHLKKTVTINAYLFFHFNNLHKKKAGNLTVYQYKNVDEMPNLNSHKKDRKTVQLRVGNSSLSVYDGLEVEYSLSYYKDGKNIYTKKYNYKNPFYNNGPKYATVDDLFKIRESGLYVFCIHKIKHKLGYWDAEITKIPVKDHVFAFQIGDGDALG